MNTTGFVPSKGPRLISAREESKAAHEEFERLLVIVNVHRPAQKLVDFIGHVGLRLLRETQVG